MRVCVCMCVICTFRGGSLCSVGLDAPFGSGVCMCVCVTVSGVVSPLQAFRGRNGTQNPVQNGITPSKAPRRFSLVIAAKVWFRGTVRLP